jgi:hypothetical protein
MQASFTPEQVSFRDTMDRLASGGLTAALGWIPAVQSGLLDLASLSFATDGPQGQGGIIELAIAAERLAIQRCELPLVGQACLGTGILAASGAEDALVDAATSGERRFAVAFAPSLREVAGSASEGAVVFDSAEATDVLWIDAGETTTTVHVSKLTRPSTSCADLTRLVTKQVSPEGAVQVGEMKAAAFSHWRNCSLILLSADMLGTMRGASAAAVRYAKEREQFGKPIGQFQAVQHLLADQIVTIEAAHAITYFAAWSVASGSPRASRAALSAKAFLSEKIRPVCETSIQVFGGMGMTWEATPHVYLRRGLLDREVLGNEDVMYRELAAEREEAQSGLQ